MQIENLLAVVHAELLLDADRGRRPVWAYVDFHRDVRVVDLRRVGLGRERRER